VIEQLFLKEIIMSKLKIIIAPDERLCAISEKVNYLDKEIITFVEQMVETMYESNGIGLAAPQVGNLKRILVMDCNSSEKETNLMKFINPQILSLSEERSEFEEGCLSLPTQYAKVFRPSSIKLKYLDINGKTLIQEFNGLEATCIQHEIDHLNGRLFIDHISKLRKNIIIKKLKRYKKINSH